MRMEPLYLVSTALMVIIRLGMTRITSTEIGLETRPLDMRAILRTSPMLTATLSSTE